MEAIRRIEQLQGNQLSLVLPELFRGKKVEVIILPYQERTTEASSAPSPHRTPSPRLRGAIKMADDLVAPVVAADEWEALK